MKYIKYICLIAFLLPLFISCDGRALFDELAENRIKVVLKGTYESNNPRVWQGLDKTIGTGDGDSSIDDLVDVTNDAAPTTFMLDVAELRMTRTDGGNPQQFANYRQTYQFPIGDENDAFFNGTGVIYENDDVTPHYPFGRILMYIRKVIFDNAKTYTKTTDVWDVATAEPTKTIFNENTVEGFDLNLLQLNSYYDTLRKEGGSTNRIFPLAIDIIDGLVFDNDADTTVLEIRFVAKNFIKMYEYEYTDTENVQHLIHYWGFSDWLRNVKTDEDDIGGNVIAVARSYVPGKTATISSTSSTATERYVIAISTDYDIATFSFVDSSERTRPPDACSPPTVQILDFTTIETVLDSYLAFEKYKQPYNIFVDCVNGEGTYVGDSYADQWTNYETNVSSFRIPPLASWIQSDGSYQITNVPIGKSYKVYYSNSIAIPANGELPDSFLECSGTQTTPVPVNADVTVDCP